MSEQEHRLTMYAGNERGNYNASCSCGYLMFNSTPDLIRRHFECETSNEQPPNDPNKRATHD